MLTEREILEHAIIGLEQRRQDMINRMALLRLELTPRTTAARPAPAHVPVPHRRHSRMTPAGRRKMSRLLKARWRQARAAGRRRL
jgi:hypothetical protein